jgi:hypothetical protein
MPRCRGRWIVAARLPGPRATALRAGEDRRRCDIELPRAGEGCVGEKLSATSAGSSPRDRSIASIARRRAMIRFGFSSAPALPDQGPKPACFIGARRPPWPVDQSPALSIDGMQLGRPARANNGHPGSCDEAGIHDPRARAALPLLLLLRPCAESRRGWFAKLVPSRGTICTSGPAGLKRKTPAAFQATSVILLHRKSPEAARIRAVLFDLLAKTLRLQLIVTRKDGQR